MNQNTLIAVNSIAQFCRTIINVGLGFYSTRILLEALGDANYGIYTLVAGIVFLISFITNALSTTSQRFLSYHQGSTNISYLKKIFSNIVIIHIILGMGLLIILESIGPFLFDGFLNIQATQIKSAKITYQCVIFMIICTCMSSPFRGLLISHQNLIYTSIIDIIDGLLKLCIAIIVLYWNFFTDRLIEYAVLLTLINMVDFLAYSIYSFIKYQECCIPRIKDLSSNLVNQITSFAGWMIYSTFMIVGRNQGTAVVLNKFLGTVANTAYGLANQMNSACLFISGSILNAFNPQIIKFEGEQKHDIAIKYAQTASKLCYLLMLIVVIPLCIYMEPLVKLWLGTIPTYSVILGRLVIISSLCDQLTTGLSIINRAVGKLKIYSLTVDTVKILTIPLMAIFLHLNLPLQIAFSSFVLMELISAFLRLPIMKKQANISIKLWFNNVIGKLVIPTLLVILFYIICKKSLPQEIMLIILIMSTGSCILLITFYFLSLNSKERKIVDNLISSIILKIRKKRIG